MGQKDPLSNYENYLIEQGILNQDLIDAYRKEFLEEIETGLDTTFAEEEVTPNTEEEITDIYAPYQPDNALPHAADIETGDRELRLVDAIKEGLEQGMEQHPSLVIMGQDVAEYGGVFKITEGFVEKFGKDRVRNTPITEFNFGGRLWIEHCQAQSRCRDAIFRLCHLRIQPNCEQLGQESLSLGANCRCCGKNANGRGRASGTFS